MPLTSEARAFASAARPPERKAAGPPRLPKWIRLPGYRPAGLVMMFCAGLTLLIWSSVAFQLHVERESAIANARHETTSFARVFEEHVLRTLRPAELVLSHVAGEYRVRGHAFDLAGFVREHRLLIEPYTMTSLTDERGNVVLASYPFKHINLSDRENFIFHAKNASKRPYVSKPQSARSTGRTTVFLSQRIDKADGSFGGIVSVGLDPQYFSRFYDQVDLGTDAVVVLIGDDGIVRARKTNDDASVGQDLSGFESFQAIRSRRAGNFVAYRTLDGVRRIFAYRVMEDYPLIVQVGRSESVVLQPYARMRAQLVGWALLITALVAAFAGMVAVQSARQGRFARAMAASEARYRSFITATSRIVWSADAAGQVVEDSATWRAYTGQTLDDYRGAGWLQAVHPEDRERVAGSWRQVVQNKAACDTEYRLRAVDGEYRSFRCRAVPVIGEAGAVREWVAVLDDMTEVRRAEAAVRASEARLRTILDAEPEWVQLLDRDCRVMDMNPAGLSMLEVAALDDVRGRTLLDFVAAEDAARLQDAAASVFRGGARSLTFELVGARGARRWIDMRCVPLRNSQHDGRITALLAVGRDMTEEKRTRDALIASRKQQQDILNSIYAFVGLFTLDGVLVEANGAPFMDAGGERDRAIGRRFWETYWWSYAGAVQRRIEDAMNRAARGEVVRTDEALRTGPDTYVRVDMQFGPLRDASGRVVQVVAFGVDITERRKAEAERAHLAHIVQTSDDAIVSRSLDHRILSWNAGARRLFGYSAEEVVGREMTLLIVPDSMKAYRSLAAHPARGAGRAAHEIACLAKDGRRIEVWMSASELHDENGELTGISLILRDITEQKRLQAQQRLAASVLESAAEGIMITDRERNIVLVNRAFTEITGFTAEDAIGKDRRLLSSAAHPSSAYEVVWEAVGRHGRWRGELWDRRKSGELYCALLSVTAVRDDSGNVVHYCAIMMDVTQRKTAEAELQRLNAELESRVAARTRQLESANNELAAFSYSVSHDLRAPVRAIEGFSALVLGKAAGQVDAETLNRLRRIRDNAQRMGLLIDDLLRLSRVSQRELDRRDFDLTALATEIVSNLRRGDPSRHVEVAVQPGMATNGDPALVRLVLENLIGNAWKFTGRTEAARIEVGVQQDAGGPVYFVRDNGAGFDMHYADKLFQAFQRLHHREDFEGTGIGLSIVHRVVGKHGGRIWADARPGEGAVFYFTLA